MKIYRNCRISLSLSLCSPNRERLVERSVLAVVGRTVSLERRKKKKKGKRSLLSSPRRKSDFSAGRGCRRGGNREDEGKARVTYARS